MGNTESNESNAAGSSEEDSAQRQRENTETAVATAVGVATAVATVAAAGWAVTKLLSSSASEDEKTNDKGKLMVAAGKKLKMNIGASLSDDQSQAGFGGVIRDEGGRWIMGFYGRISMRDCTPEQAVIWGINNGLKIIQEEKFREVEIESVSEPAVIQLRDKTRRKSRIDDIVEECRGMLLSTGCKLNYTDRKGIAESLAELGRDQVTDLVRLISLPRMHARPLLNTRNAIQKMMDATGGKLKMNTDASLSGDPSRAGFGGVIRDGSGRWIMGFYGRILRDCSNSEQAEIWGIYNGLKIIQEEKFREVKIEIKSDSEQAINHLTTKTRKMSAINDIIEECKGMLEITGCSLNHTSRKGNKVADALAELGRDRGETDLVRLITLPKEIKSLLDVDARSASSYY
ncbi:uncharacterized protein LOC131301035 [Rhododendron vialii]|uniref:uncharacterized protein LOC131301035 n=1 Tax=Rhododendron vialii TaxID=182163 RepID=UPI00265DE337|nr:uncharacterized protein LOC131301035 [Rhododendron vialii]